MFKAKQFTSAAIWVLVVILAGASPLKADSDPFPLPEIIAPNVRFWIKVYSEFATSQGIIHDSVDLERIYDVIDLIPYDVPEGGEVNRSRIKAAVAEYESILHRLAGDPESADPKCRRIGALFREPHDSQSFAAAAGRVRCQAGQKDRFRAGLVRSGAYLDQIKDVLRSRGLPEDLAYLPHVESSFNPFAYSKFGAAGMWQFTRSTGQRFMQVGYVIDERRDPIVSTLAAAALLKENFEKLGSWPLAITAYNHGAAGMQRARELHGQYDQVFQHYSSPSFKFASRNFYSEFLAARQVASHYRDYFGELELDRPVPTKTVVLQGYASIKDLSRHFKVDPQKLKEMNLALRQPVFSGQKHVPKGYALRLPAPGEKPAFEVAALPDSVYSSGQVPTKFYTVKNGDTLFKIARFHGLQLNELLTANALGRDATIQPQQTLRIPGPPKGSEAALAAASPSPSAPAAVSRQSSAAAAAKTEPAERAAATVAAAAPAAVLASMIPLPAPEAKLSGAQQALEAKLQVSNQQIVTAGVAFERVLENSGRRIGIIQVEVEETIGHYAGWAGIRAQQIRELNRMRGRSVLRLHQKLKIPLTRVSADAFEQNRYEYHKRLQEDFFTVYRIGELRAYKVRKGDNYWDLCQEKFQIPLWLLKHANAGVDLAELTPGQQLMIPSIEKASSGDADPGMQEEPQPDEIVPSPQESDEADPVSGRAPQTGPGSEA